LADSVPASTSFPRPDARPQAGSAPVVRAVELDAQAASIWQALERSLGTAGLTNSWAWTSCWLDSFGSTVPHWFAVAEVAGKPVGIALLTRGRSQKRGPLPVRTVHIGTSGEEPGRGVWIEYNRLLVADEWRERFLDQLLKGPGVRPLSTDLIALDGFDPAEIPAVLLPRLTVREEVCRVARLDQKPTVLECFDGDTRRKMRKNSKRFAEAFGDLRTEWIESPERALVALDELMEHHQARWTAVGKPGAFADERFVLFHRLLIERTLTEGRVVMARVTAGEQLIGIFYGFIEGEVIYQYQWGLPQFDDNSLSPGFVTGYQVMLEAKERGFAEVNWLAGDSRYKRDLSNAERTLVWAEKGVSPWHTVLNGLIRVYGNRAKRSED
jgi:CelD/BcsL family acetyltransferase involved in cellulose biosynthesis